MEQLHEKLRQGKLIDELSKSTFNQSKVISKYTDNTHKTNYRKRFKLE